MLMLSYSYFSSMQQLMSASHGALTAISAAGKVEEILEMDTSRAYDPSIPADPEDFEGIRMEQVSYGYEGRERALTDISLRIPKGSVAALVGLSGCGKSTILRLLLRFYAPTEGEILINGIPLEKISFRELHQRITFPEQHPHRLRPDPENG